MSNRRAFLCLVLTACVLSSLSFAVTPDRVTGVIDSSRTVALARSHRPQATPQYDQGLVDPALKLSAITLVIAPSPTQQAALDRLLVAQQNPKSSLYHKWLTPAQYADQFGLSANDIKHITGWLRSQGFMIQRIGGGRNSIVFSGTAAQVQSAFQAEIHQYEVNGEKHYANATPLMLPAALNGVVTAIHGVDNFRMKPMISRRYRGQYTFPLGGGSYVFFAAPGDVATLYDINTLYNASPAIDGTGQKLAIVGETDIYLSDISDFRSASTGFGLPPISGCTTGATGLITACNTTNFAYVLIGTDPGIANSIQDDLEEADLDVEWSGATARNAQIVYVNAPDTSGNGVYDSLTAVINPPSGPPLAPVVSMSYGQCELIWFTEGGPSLESELQQAAVEGVTVMNSSDDEGSAGCDAVPPGTTNVLPPHPYEGAQYGLGVSYPASSQWVTAVGGTSIPLVDFTTTYWNLSNGSFGASALTTLIGQEQAWNDDEEIGQFCQGDPSNTFCSQGGSPPVSGWVPLTSSATAQQVQEDIWISQGGGGASNCFSETGGICTGGVPQPTWQQGLSVPSAPAGVRLLPDVSLLASPNYPGYIFCTELSELGESGSGSSCASGITGAINANSIIGGTSASSPIFAGIVTLLNQYLGANGLGAINSTLYSLAATSSNGAFHPATSGNNNVYCQAGKPAGQPSTVICPSSGVIGYSASNADTATRYNLVTGLGSVDVNNLAVAWAASLTSYTISASGATPTSVAAGNSATATVTIATTNGFTGTVTFSCPSAPEGITCSAANVTGSGSTTLTINTQISTAASGSTPYGITVVGTSGSQSQSTTVSLAVTATTESFTLTISGGNPSAAQGATANVNIMVNGANGFDPTKIPLTYSCTTTAPETTCIYPTGPTTTNTSLAVGIQLITTAPTSAANHSMRGSRIFYAALLPGLLGIMFTAGSRKRSLRGMRMLGLIMFLGCSTLWLGSCGGSSSGTSNPGTPVGSYTVTVGASTGGAAPVSNNVQFQLNVVQ
jgi:subtilase family serine protease